MNSTLVAPVNSGSASSSGDVAAMSAPAVSWAAIIAGALVAASATLILVTLGAGFGFAALSPWPHGGGSATAFAVSTAIGLIVVQWISAALGGYITGRLRARWVSVHTHEVFFRDTAHGLITWATSTLLIAAVAAGVAMSIAGGAARATSSVATAAAAAPGTADPYDIDTLLRPAGGQPAASSDAHPLPAAGDLRAQVTRIVARGMVMGTVPDADRNFLVQTVSAQTGIEPAEAQMRVDALVTKTQQASATARQAAEAARKAAEESSLFTAFAMIIGAFIACVSAALGGRLRDLHP